MTKLARAAIWLLAPHTLPEFATAAWILVLLILATVTK